MAREEVDAATEGTEDVASDDDEAVAVGDDEDAAADDSGSAVTTESAVAVDEIIVATGGDKAATDAEAGAVEIELTSLGGTLVEEPFGPRQVVHRKESPAFSKVQAWQSQGLEVTLLFFV